MVVGAAAYVASVRGNMPKYQVTMRSYFSIPNPRAFDDVSQDGGRVIIGSAVMGFLTDPQTCLDNAAGDLRMMGCTIYYKKCQEVDTVAKQVLVGAPNTIEEDIIKQTMDEELKILENKLLLMNKDYKITSSKSKKWILYAVVREFPAGMPWEGAEEKKQKQGTNNARLAYVLHVHQPDYKKMKTLLAYAKEMAIWHIIGGMHPLPSNYLMRRALKGGKRSISKWFKFMDRYN